MKYRVLTNDEARGVLSATTAEWFAELLKGSVIHVEGKRPTVQGGQVDTLRELGRRLRSRQTPDRLGVYLWLEDVPVPRPTTVQADEEASDSDGDPLDMVG